jgi:hypothetical protein
MRKLSFALLCAALLIAGCGYRGIKPEEQEKLGKQVSATMAEIITAAEKVDTSVLDKYLADSPGVRFYLGGRSYGKKGFIDAIGEYWAPYSSQKIQVMNPGTMVFSPEAAMWTAQTSSIAAAKEGQGKSFAHCETWIWQKVEGYWRVVHCDVNWPHPR